MQVIPIYVFCGMQDAREANRPLDFWMGAHKRYGMDDSFYGGVYKKSRTRMISHKGGNIWTEKGRGKLSRTSVRNPKKSLEILDLGDFKALCVI